MSNNLDGSKGSKGSKHSGSLHDSGDMSSRNKRKIRKPKSNVDLKKHWIKATYNRATKRILNAPLELEELKIALWMRFGALRD